MEFEKIMDTPDNVIVLGGGWSVKDQAVDTSDLINRGYVIGVNDSALLAPCDAAISIDRQWLKNRWDTISDLAAPTWIRDKIYREINKPLWTGASLFHCNPQNQKLSDQPGKLNGFNSGFCAINLAYQIRPKNIFLFGLDHCRSPDKTPYWYPNYPWAASAGGTTSKSYLHWTTLYLEASLQLRASNIKVYNVSPKSKVFNFEKIDYERFLKICSP